MEILSRVRNLLADDRFDANLVGIYGLIVLVVIIALILRRLLTSGSNRLARWTGGHWLHAVGAEATRHARRLLFWLTVAAVFGAAATGLVYHLAGRDIRTDLAAFWAKMTLQDLVAWGLDAGALAALLFACRFGVWLIRRHRPTLQSQVTAWVGRAGAETVVQRWFVLLELYAVAGIYLVAVWAAGQVVGWGRLADKAIGFVLSVLTILVVARLLTLACGILSRLISELGDRHFGHGNFRLYWERITRLFPFGERCFETAVYVSAAWMCLQEVYRFTPEHEYGPRIVRCIGILFTSRVLIELLQVLLNQAFGLYDQNRHIDQKGQTLVPLLQSICQYVIYFGAGVVMLDALQIPTAPILAGAGIVGLGVGLGAQSLVTDVVSGFFILFENQYLVGDFVQIGDATGTVEAVGIRLTQIRDGNGRLFIIPNGQIKGVINYSKGYVNAVVDIKVPSGSDLEGVFRSMTEAGRRLRQLRHEVVADTEIHGLVDLTTSDMTIRAVTRVQPGTHVAMQNQYRRILKQVLDQDRAANQQALAA
jgi:small conductance mechanosensitive channel